MTVILTGCFAAELTTPHFLEDPVEITGGYLLAVESGYGYVISMPPRSREGRNQEYDVIVTHVNALSWDADFIVVEASPSSDLTHEWDIIVVATGQIYHCAERLREVSERPDIADTCVTYQEFLDLRERLGVPNDLRTRDVHDVYNELRSRAGQRIQLTP